MSEPLPACPLCGGALLSNYREAPYCPEVGCDLAGFSLPESAWRRLAAPFEILRRAKSERCGCGNHAHAALENGCPNACRCDMRCWSRSRLLATARRSRAEKLNALALKKAVEGK